MENDNSQAQASPAPIEESPAEISKPEEAKPAVQSADVPSYKIGGVFMLTILSFALFLNLFVIGIALLTMPK